MTLIREYDYLVQIDPSWSGPKNIAGRPLTHNLVGYDMFLGPMTGSIFRSTNTGRRSSASITILNKEFGGKLVSKHAEDDPIENKTVSILELFRDEPTARTIFVGVVKRARISETGLVLELVEPSLNRSTRLAKTISTDIWPRARRSDVGRPLILPIGDVVDANPPILKHNLSTTIAVDLDDSTEDIEVNNIPDDFPASGLVRIDEEVISYQSITPANPVLQTNAILVGVPGSARGQSGTVAKAHSRGRRVVVVDTFAIGIDSEGGATTVDAISAINAEGERIALPLPPTTIVENGVTIAQWDETPTFLEETGPKDIQRVELDGDFGSTSSDPLNAAGDNPAFEGRNFSTITIAPNETLALQRTQSQAFLGKIEKVIATILHSGNRGDVSRLGLANVFVGGTQVGLLSSTDKFDSDLQAVARGRNRGPVDVPVPPESGNATITPDVAAFDQVSASGIARWVDPVLDPARSNDGVVDPPPGRAAFLGPGTTGFSMNRYQISLNNLPVNVSPTAVIDSISFRVRHGGDTEADSINAFPGELSGYIINVRQGGAFPGTLRAQALPVTSVPIVDDVATWSTPAALTINDLPSFVFEMQFNQAAASPNRTFAVYEVFVDVEFTDTSPQRDSGSIQNDFEVPASVASTWDDLQNLPVLVVGDGTNEFFVYHVLFNVIYTPQRVIVPERFAANLDAAVDGDPATVISELWSLVGNGPATIDAASFAAASARLIAEGYTASTIRGLVRNRELFAVVNQIAEEFRLRVYVELAILKAAYIEDYANLPPTSRVVVKDDLSQRPQVARSDIETAIVNRVVAKFDRTDLEQFRGEEVDSNPASIALYQEKTRDLNLDYVATSAAALKTAGLIIERFSLPYDNLSYKVTLLLKDISLLELQELYFGPWYQSPRFEVESISDTLDHQINIQGREL